MQEQQMEMMEEGEVAVAAATVAWYWYAGVFDSSTEPVG